MNKEMASFMIGGQEIKLGPLTIWSLERCWDDIKALAQPSDPFARTRTQLNIVVAGLQIKDPGTNVEDLTRRITWGESQELSVGMIALLRISGFAPQEGTQGGLPGEAEAMISTETGPESSPNLSPTE